MLFQNYCECLSSSPVVKMIYKPQFRIFCSMLLLQCVSGILRKTWRKNKTSFKESAFAAAKASVGEILVLSSFLCCSMKSQKSCPTSQTTPWYPSTDEYLHQYSHTQSHKCNRPSPGSTGIIFIWLLCVLSGGYVEFHGQLFKIQKPHLSDHTIVQ